MGVFRLSIQFDWKTNSLNYIYFMLTAQHWLFMCPFISQIVRCGCRLAALQNRRPRHVRRFLRCWIMLTGSTPNYPKHLGATLETSFGDLINARLNPPADWQFRLVRKISLPPHQHQPTNQPPQADFKTAEYGCVVACVYDIYYFILLMYDFAVGRPLLHMLPTQH